MKKIIGETIARLRKDKGLTQKELADQLYISNKTISKWENGTSLPDIQATIDIAKYFNVSIDELLTGESVLNATLVDKSNTNCSLLIFLNIFIMALNFIFVIVDVNLALNVGVSILGIFLSLIIILLVKRETLDKNRNIWSFYLSVSFLIAFLVMLVSCFIFIY